MFWHREKKTPLPLCTADLGLSIINSNSCLGKNHPYLWILTRTFHLALLCFSTAWDIPCPSLAQSCCCADEVQTQRRTGMGGRRWQLSLCRKGKRGAGCCFLSSLPLTYSLSPVNCPFALPPHSPAARVHTPQGLLRMWGSIHRQLRKAVPGMCLPETLHKTGTHITPKISVEHPRGQKQLFLVKLNKWNYK